MAKHPILLVSPVDKCFGGQPVPRVIRDIDIDTAESFVAFFDGKVHDFPLRRHRAKAIVEFCEWLDWRGHNIYQLRPITVSIYLDQLRFRTSPAIAKEHWIALRIFFEWALQREILEVNPAAVVPDPRLEIDCPAPTASQPASTGIIDIDARSPAYAGLPLNRIAL